MTLSPDYYAAIPVREIPGEAYDSLRTVWPAAYEAMTNLMLAQEEGEIHAASSLNDLTLYDLIQELL